MKSEQHYRLGQLPLLAPLMRSERTVVGVVVPKLIPAASADHLKTTTPVIPLIKCGEKNLYYRSVFKGHRFGGKKPNLQFKEARV